MNKLSFFEKKWIKKFSCNLNNLMNEKGINQTDLAKISGVSKSTISKYSSGKISPKFYHVINIAKSLGVYIDDLT